MIYAEHSERFLSRYSSVLFVLNIDLSLLISPGCSRYPPYVVLTDFI